jgi:hypothetical protein
MTPILKAFAALLCLFPAALASAGVPDPTRSTVDPCFATCPFGDIAFTVVVRDFANNPIQGSSVALLFTDCPAVHLCPDQEAGTTVLASPPMALRSSGVGGSTTFHLHAGGVCPGARIAIYADGVVLATRDVASTDQNGDLIVDATDQTLLIGKVGGTDPGADLTCDHFVDSQDVTTQGPHLGHSCDSATPVKPRSWGRLKMLYR